MSKATILTVDDDPMVLRAITRDLRARYGADYRIVRASSGARPWPCWPNWPCASGRSP